MRRGAHSKRKHCTRVPRKRAFQCAIGAGPHADLVVGAAAEHPPSAAADGKRVDGTELFRDIERARHDVTTGVRFPFALLHATSYARISGELVPSAAYS